MEIGIAREPAAVSTKKFLRRTVIVCNYLLSKYTIFLRCDAHELLKKILASDIDKRIPQRQIKSSKSLSERVAVSMEKKYPNVNRELKAASDIAQHGKIVGAHR
jgi:hypothetical protein